MKNQKIIWKSLRQTFQATKIATLTCVINYVPRCSDGVIEKSLKKGMGRVGEGRRADEVPRAARKGELFPPLD